MRTKIVYSGASGSGEICSANSYPWENVNHVLKPETELPFIPQVGETVNAQEILSPSTMTAICTSKDKWTDIKAIVYSVDYDNINNDFKVEILIL